MRADTTQKYLTVARCDGVRHLARREDPRREERTVALAQEHAHAPFVIRSTIEVRGDDIEDTVSIHIERDRIFGPAPGAEGARDAEAAIALAEQDVGPLRGGVIDGR